MGKKIHGEYSIEIFGDYCIEIDTACIFSVLSFKFPAIIFEFAV